MDTISQHFQVSERPFVEIVQKWMELIEKTGQSKLTDFLNPREQEIVSLLIPAKSSIRIRKIPQVSAFERLRLLIHLEDTDVSEIQSYDSAVSLLEIQFASKFHSLSHSSVLGSILGLGIKRNKIGDILIDSDIVQVVVTDELVAYVVSEMKQVGNVAVRLKQVSFDQLIDHKENVSNESKIVSSLRLDTVLSAVFQISREKSKQYVITGKVKVNHRETLDPDYLVEASNVISMRGFGRVVIDSLDGKTKKDKFKLVIQRYKK